MTTEQLDHLRAIDAHLDALLALAAKRTPGRWDTMGVAHSNCLRLFSGNDYLGIIGSSDAEKLKIQDDATYIAACAGRAEAGWRSTKTAIACLFACYPDGNIAARSFNAQQMAESILAAWPRELLTLP